MSYIIVKRDSNKKQIFKAADNNVIDFTMPALQTTLRVMPMLEGWMSVRMMTRIGCSPYVNWFSDFESCVFEWFVIFAIRKNYLANYVQKLR